MPAIRVLALTPLFSLISLVATAQPSPGTTAQTHLAAAQAHAKTWRPDAVLFQIQARNVTDGKANWEYDFMSAGAPGKCLMVGVANGKAQSASDSCNTTGEKAILSFTVDSDKAVQAARAAGLARPKLTVGLTWSGSGSSDKLVWMIMEDRGTAKGDQMVDVDAMTGIVTSKTRQP